jgi:CHAD domain-containing protein
VRAGLDPEDVHQYRVGIRRLRSDLRTFGSLFRSQPRRDLARRLRWLGEYVGPVRDDDVLAERLEHDTNRLKRIDPDARSQLFSRLAEEHRIAREAMLIRLESEQYVDLCHLLNAFVERPPVRSRHLSLLSQPAGAVATRFVRTPWLVLEDGVRALGQAPSDAALHQVRIFAKRTRYAAEAIGPLVEGAAEFAGALARVQTVLGTHHDTVVAEAWLADVVRRNPEASRLAHDLIFRQRVRRARALAGWPGAWEQASAAELRTWL